MSAILVKICFPHFQQTQSKMSLRDRSPTGVKTKISVLVDNRSMTEELMITFKTTASDVLDQFMSKGIIPDANFDLYETRQHEKSCVYLTQSDLFGNAWEMRSWWCYYSIGICLRIPILF
jgi:hypothetical protein